MRATSDATAPATQKRTVSRGRLPNGHYRTREYLTEREVDRLMQAAGDNRHGHRDATMILDAEAIVLLDSQPGKGFGFQLRTTSQTEDHAGMLRLLRSAFSRNKTVALDYIRTGIRNGRIIRVAIVE